MKLKEFVILIAMVLAVLLIAGCASSGKNIGPYTVTFDGIDEEYKYGGESSKAKEFKTDSGVSYTEYSRMFWKENMEGDITIGVNTYAIPMYNDNQNPREVLKSLIEPNDNITIENIEMDGKPGILAKEKFIWAGGEPGATYMLFYWLDPKTRVGAYFMESPKNKWDDASKAMMSIKVS